GTTCASFVESRKGNDKVRMKKSWQGRAVTISPLPYRPCLHRKFRSVAARRTGSASNGWANGRGMWEYWTDSRPVKRRRNRTALKAVWPISSPTHSAITRNSSPQGNPHPAHAHGCYETLERP